MHYLGSAGEAGQELEAVPHRLAHGWFLFIFWLYAGKYISNLTVHDAISNTSLKLPPVLTPAHHRLPSDDAQHLTIPDPVFWSVN